MLDMILVGFVALIQVYIMIFEIFMWERRGPKVFGSFPEDLFQKTTALAGNQGLYNGFLAAGLIWSMLIGDPVWNTNVATFFLLCVAVAGLYGAATVEKKIILVQTLPASVALLALYL